jgi:hypothetical protein
MYIHYFKDSTNPVREYFLTPPRSVVFSFFFLLTFPPPFLPFFVSPFPLGFTPLHRGRGLLTHRAPERRPLVGQPMGAHRVQLLGHRGVYAWHLLRPGARVSQIPGPAVDDDEDDFGEGNGTGNGPVPLVSSSGRRGACLVDPTERLESGGGGQGGGWRRVRRKEAWWFFFERGDW